MTNAIQNSLHSGTGRQPGDGPMGISLAVTPSSATALVKSAITNASFRTKKLPEDISLDEEGDSKLATIEEDGPPDTPTQPGGARGSGRMAKGAKGPTKKAKDAKVKDARRESDVSTKSGASLSLNGEGGDSLGVVVKSQSKSALVDSVELTSITRRVPEDLNRSASHAEDGEKVLLREKSGATTAEICSTNL